MISNSVVAPINAAVIVRSSLPAPALANGRAKPARGPRVPCAASTRAASSALARSVVASGPSRPRIDTPRDRAPDVPSAGAIGIHSSVVLGNLNFGGMTPTIVCGMASSLMIRPIADGSPW